MSRLDLNQIQSAFDAVDAGLIVLGADGRVLAWNAWIAVASGVSQDAAAGRTLDDIFPACTTTRLPMAVTDALTLGASSVLTQALHPSLFPLATRAGRAMIHNVAIHPLPGDPPLCLVEINDVTVPTERDRVLRERQNARYDAVVDSAPDAIITLDSDGVVQMANPAAARQFGYSLKELLGEPIAMLFQDQHGWTEAWRTLLDQQALTRPVELVARRKDGAPSFLEMSASSWVSASRTFVTAILRDVNERRAVEDALRTLNQTLERRVAERTADRDRMWRLSTDVMLVARLDGVINATNPAWSHLLGWNEATLEGASLHDFIVEEDRERFDAALREMASSRAPRLFEVRVRTGDGGQRWIAWSAVAADNLLQAVGRDVTAEREAEEALRQAEEALRQSQKMEAIGQLTGGIAHDFNNLLTGIIGSMDILKRRISAGRYEDLDRFMDAAVASGNRAAALTHRLLAFARRQPLDPQPLDLNRLILSMDDLLRRSLGEQIRLEIRLGDDLWPALTDANQLENALLNLAINARDAMPDGGRLIIETSNTTLTQTEAAGQPEIEGGDYTLISVTDTGVGMSRETAARAFDPFFTTKPIGQGTGLGLSMIYGFARQSRGHVRLESEEGRGTTIRLYLPRHRGAGAVVDVEPVAQAPRGAGETVLVVEDDPSVRQLIAEVLRELGYACLQATDGQGALPLLHSPVRLDLMITDVGLPGLNGRQLGEIGRQLRPGLKVLFVTGYAEHATIRGGFLGAGMDMVTKPFTLDALALKIRQMIES